MKRTMLRWAAVVITAVVASTLFVAAPAEAATTGLDGTVTNALTGAPVAGADVVISMPDGSNWNQANADNTGYFSIPSAAAGQYHVEILANGYVTQWANGHTNQYDADLITVPGSIQVSLMPIQYGSITGHVLTDAGKAVKDVGVEVRYPFNGNQVAWTSTDANGAYHFDRLETGSYIVGFHYPSGYTVWYQNTLDPFSATPVTVTANAATVVDTTQPPFGAITVTVKDFTTGLPLAGACFYYQSGPFNFNTACSGSNGKATVTGIPVGTYQVGVGGPSNDYLNGDIQGIAVTENHTTNKTVKLRKGAKIHVSFVDSATGDPVTGACVGMVAATDRNWVYPPWCGSGNSYVDVFGLGPSKFRLFAAVYDGSHGAQWVGATGGTGDPDAAASYTVTYGQQLDVTVRFDGSGNIAGTVTSAATGNGVDGVCPTATAPSGTYYPAFNSMCTYSDGTYQLNELGPYAWKVAFPNYSGNYAWTWSGGGANRAKATAVQVIAGSTVTVNATLPASGKISGTLTPPAGGTPRAATIYAVDATTGDFAGGEPFINDDGTFTIGGLNTQKVWVYYSYNEKTYKYPTKLTTIAGATISGITLVVPTS